DGQTPKTLSSRVTPLAFWPLKTSVWPTETSRRLADRPGSAPAVHERPEVYMFEVRTRLTSSMLRSRLFVPWIVALVWSGCPHMNDDERVRRDAEVPEAGMADAQVDMPDGATQQPDS